MKTNKILKVGAFLSIAAFAVQALAGSATPSAILVLPARARMVQMAFQVASIKDVGLVCYDDNALTKNLLIHVWNGHEWIRIAADEYTSGAFMVGIARDVFILGPATTVPAVMTADPIWGKTTHRIAELDSATVLNELGKILNFSSRQWKWLANNNGMKLTDRNEERRRYGRWGKSGVDTSAIPRTAAPAPAAADVITMPPTEPLAEPTPVAHQIVTPPVAPVVEPPVALDPTIK